MGLDNTFSAEDSKGNRIEIGWLRKNYQLDFWMKERWAELGYPGDDGSRDFQCFRFKLPMEVVVALAAEAKKSEPETDLFTCSYHPEDDEREELLRICNRAVELIEAGISVFYCGC